MFPRVLSAQYHISVCPSSWHQQGDAGQEETSGVSDEELHEGKPTQAGAAVEQLPQPEVIPAPSTSQTLREMVEIQS